MVLEKSNGEEIVRTYDLAVTGKKFKLANQKVLEVHPEKDNIVKIVPENPKSQRTVPLVLFTIIFTSFILTLLLASAYYLFKTLYWKTIVVHFGIHLIFFLSTLPGFYNIDTIFYFDEVRDLDISPHFGLFGVFLNGITQALPYSWVITAFNIIIITLIISRISIIASKLKVAKIFYACCFIYYLYPANLFITLYASRDTSSQWIFVIFCLELYLYFLENIRSQKRLMLLSLGAAISVLFRPELLYVLIIYLPLMSSFFFKDHIKWSLLTCLLIGLTGWFKTIPVALEEVDMTMAYNAYESTAIINPLSYILKKRYSELPPEIDQKLGKFFKNEYLIKYQNNNDIDPYHMGGVNFNSTPADYKQFRAESIKIILSHPLLFLENRIKIISTMLNIGKDPTYLGASTYYLNPPEEEIYRRVKRNFSFSNFESLIPKHSPVWKFFNWYVNDNEYRSLKSYLIPFVLMVICLAYVSFKSLYFKILLLPLMRMGIVFLTAGGGYFKYNYSFWIFCLFACPFVIYEKRKSKLSPSHQSI